MTDLRTSTKVFHFSDNSRVTGERQDVPNSASVTVQEVLDPSYGCYLWPSSLVLAEYVWHERLKFLNSTVLETGAGTSLPSLLLTRLLSTARPHLIITDLAPILPNIRTSLLLNGVCDDDRVWVRELLWGEFGPAGVDAVIDELEGRWPGRKVDWVMGSDTFYNPKDFEPILVTISYIITYHNPRCRFITAYQERSAKRTIQHLLEKWDLQCRVIPREIFEFDEDKYYGMEGGDGKEERGATMDYAGTLASVVLLEIRGKGK